MKTPKVPKPTPSSSSSSGGVASKVLAGSKLVAKKIKKQAAMFGKK